MPTAAILIIGNEILSGKVRDENSPWLAVRLRQSGVDLVRIQVLGDSLPLIEAQVRAMSQEVDHLFTSGGIGPTHDDITIQAVARAFDQRMEPRKELITRLSTRFSEQDRGGPRHQALIRMCTLPVNAELLIHEDLFFPLITVENVVVLPGVPHLFQRKFEAFSHLFRGSPVESRQFYTLAEEPRFAQELGQIQARWQTVEIGSYPQKTDSGWRAMLTLDSRDADALSRCSQEIEGLCTRLEAEISSTGKGG